MQIHLHDVKILQIHNTRPEFVSRLLSNQNPAFLYKEIYHVWEGYLRKIPVLRLNFPRHSAREIFRLSTSIFRKYPSQK
jgi:hypothetical protein